MNQQSLSEQAYKIIKHKIVSLELPPGGVINEQSLREELQLGRTPIREALQRLALEDLVHIVPRRGMFVTDISLTDLQQLFELRLTLEGLAVRYATRRGQPGHWQKMAEVLDTMPGATEQVNNEKLINIDRTCHEIIYEAAQNKFLRNQCITHYALSLRLWYFFLNQIGDMRGAIEEHAHILNALRDRDEETAVKLMEQHIQAFQDEIQSTILGNSATHSGAIRIN